MVRVVYVNNDGTLYAHAHIYGLYCLCKNGRSYLETEREKVKGTRQWIHEII